MREIIVDDRSEAIIETSLLKKSRKIFSSSLSFLFFVIIKLHIDARKKTKRTFHAVVKFMFKELKKTSMIAIIKK